MKPTSINSLIKSTAIATLISLAMVTTASASESNSTTASSAKLGEFKSLIAQKYSPPDLLHETRSRRFIDEMIMLRMNMVKAAEDALQSQDPEIKKMAQEIIKSSNAEVNRMMEMRRKRYEDG